MMMTCMHALRSCMHRFQSSSSAAAALVLFVWTCPRTIVMCVGAMHAARCYDTSALSIWKLKVSSHRSYCVGRGSRSYHKSIWYCIVKAFSMSKLHACVTCMKKLLAFRSRFMYFEAACPCCSRGNIMIRPTALFTLRGCNNAMDAIRSIAICLQPI